MPLKIAINGFGRIGRSLFKIITDNYPEISIVAINDLSTKEQLSHLLKYDSIYGIYSKDIILTEKGISINGRETFILNEANPENLPWKEMDVDIVIESTGRFSSLEEAKKHNKSGAKYVIISAPSKGEGIPSYILGVNEKEFNPLKDFVIDMGSCTTNCLAPIAKIIEENFSIKKGFITTIHSYTNDQKILDISHNDLRRARAAGINMIPTSTGAAKTISKVIPSLLGKLDGVAIRVPTPIVSLLDFFVETERETTREEIISFFEKASSSTMKGIISLEKNPLVSSDYIRNSHSAIIDAPLLMVNKNMIKIMAWYDNEYGYSFRLAEFIKFIGGKI